MFQFIFNKWQNSMQDATLLRINCFLFPNFRASFTDRLPYINFGWLLLWHWLIIVFLRWFMNGSCKINTVTCFELIVC